MAFMWAVFHAFRATLVGLGQPNKARAPQMYKLYLAPVSIQRLRASDSTLQGSVGCWPVLEAGRHGEASKRSESEASKVPEGSKSALPNRKQN